MERSLFLSKKKKISRNVVKQLHELFDSGLNANEGNWWYRKVTYLFDLGTYFVWTNTPRKYLDVGKLMGVFYFIHYNGDWWD